MVRNKVVKKSQSNTVHILVNNMPFASIGVMVNDAGIPTVDGKKIIKAGTPVGGSNSTFENEAAILTSTNTPALANQTQGILLHDVDVSYGVENATLLFEGTVNEARFEDDVVVIGAVKTALDGKITFLNRNK